MNNFASTAANKLHAARSDTITAGDSGTFDKKDNISECFIDLHRIKSKQSEINQKNMMMITFS